jgi:hypothetical protein
VVNRTYISRVTIALVTLLFLVNTTSGCTRATHVSRGDFQSEDVAVSDPLTVTTTANDTYKIKDFSTTDSSFVVSTVYLNGRSFDYRMPVEILFSDIVRVERTNIHPVAKVVSKTFALAVFSTVILLWYDAAGE